MSLNSVVRERVARWCYELSLWAFTVDDEAPTIGPGQFTLRANRRVIDLRPGAKSRSVVIAIREVWLPGEDPARLVAIEHGCFCAISAWHAQIHESRGAHGAFRLDVDRSKPAALRVHRHPLGEPNEIREAVDPPLPALEAWLEEVDLLIATGA